jgi:hypothetical protein
MPRDPVYEYQTTPEDEIILARIILAIMRAYDLVKSPPLIPPA